MAEIWIADDDASIRFVLGEALREDGAAVREFADAESLLAALDGAVPDVALSDVRMPGASGLKLLDEIKARGLHIPVIVMSAFTDVASTAAAYRTGAFDYLPKPFDLDQVRAAVERALAQSRPPPPLPAHEPEQELIGSAPAMRELFRRIGRVAATDLNVLVTGETGTGKELVARALHRHSARAPRPFVAMNTAAIPAELLESELFGHEAGAFTGALRRHPGRFEQAEGGTLFLDEIGDMPLALQTRLLRVLAQGEFYRVGGRELIRADVRVIAATHQDLDAKVENGQFRADLLHRLDVVRLHLPPLGERREDIPLLAARFLARAAADMRLEEKNFSPAALGALAQMPWPGNVRQLENLCRRLAVMASGREIRVSDLPSQDAGKTAGAGWQDVLRRAARERLARGERNVYAQLRAAFDQALLEAALTENGNQRGRAAAQLGLGRNTLTRKLGSSRIRKRSKP
ncbi:MAG: nitrogen regulation protein NR(I) [Xanthomonadaceae bacterium]|nr:nitrogen regulation protein NR(I) [Xanthomonadaceae bacterium]MDE2258685.1 nitrogen regulation protein NR(I) [Xanthomonadaceae bacterium]